MAAGFTLVELLVVVLVAALLMGLAVPALQNMVSDNHLNAVADDLAGALNLARSEAGRLNATVALTPATGGWANGWTVAPTATGSTTLRTGSQLPNGYALAASTAFATAGVTFDGTGRFANANGATAEFVICQNGGPFGGNGAARMITVSPSGRIRIAQNASGVPLDDNNNPITGCAPA